MLARLSIVVMLLAVATAETDIYICVNGVTLLIDVNNIEAFPGYTIGQCPTTAPVTTAPMETAAPTPAPSTPAAAPMMTAPAVANATSSASAAPSTMASTGTNATTTAAPMTTAPMGVNATTAPTANVTTAPTANATTSPAASIATMAPSAPAAITVAPMSASTNSGAPTSAPRKRWEHQQHAWKGTGTFNRGAMKAVERNGTMTPPPDAAMNPASRVLMFLQWFSPVSVYENPQTVIMFFPMKRHNGGRHANHHDVKMGRTARRIADMMMSDGNMTVGNGLLGNSSANLPDETPTMRIN
ncbi:Uncharacterized protein PBTT_09336 [Plasmodiophora brassicae]|uniref:Uncharacterized protein n=1 Tax=Plasmodiophora brassicae TaxID=37360 RepID=A0A0G4IJ36_PLABS|nr:secrectory protein [Plasmodiophora brassicae]CEO95090.1 hypothetical protein PBRA_009622 [Plasmodiophora brassicae]